MISVKSQRPAFRAPDPHNRRFELEPFRLQNTSEPVCSFARRSLSIEARVHTPETAFPRILIALLLLTAAKPQSFGQTTASPLSQLSASIRELTRRVSPAVVEIVVTGYGVPEEENDQASNQIGRMKSSGSGVVVDPAGYIMTNAHVVKGAVTLKVSLGNSRSPTSRFQVPRTFDARVLGVDRESDLALLKIEAQGLPSLTFGDSDKVSQGDLVLALGSPMHLRNSLAMGVVSSPARAISDDNPILYVQTDASINPGDSGGALIDINGHLIGLNTFIFSKSGGNEGIGFAIPSDVVRNVYRQLRHEGVVSRGTLGIYVQNITSAMAEGLDLALKSGVVVADVDDGGPGDIAGFKRRDIILTLNGKGVQTAREFDDAIYRRGAGVRVIVTVERGNDVRSLIAQIGSQTAKEDRLSALISPAEDLIPRLGIFCLEIDDKLTRLIPELRRHYGLLVAAKAPDSQASFIDLRAGDVIHQMNNLPIGLFDVFRAKIDELKPGDAVALQIERDGRLQYVAFEIE
jgi:serine protease Do